MDDIKRLRELKESLTMAQKMGLPIVPELKAEIEKLKRRIREERSADYANDQV